MPYIEFMDLQRQYKTHKSGIEKALANVCASAAFSGGEYAEQFEKEFAAYQGARFAAGVSNGTDALHLAMRALGIQAGDEVIIPANTFIASAWGPVYTNAKPVFIDCENDTWQIDVSQVEAAITEKTKAIIGVHLYGQPFDVDALKSIACKYKLFLVEDCAQAHGAEYKGKRLGALADAGSFSFYPGKNLGAYGEAGMTLSNNEALIKHINALKNHGSYIRYYHDEIGYNNRLDGIQAAILSYKLRFLDSWTERRREIAKMYFDGIVNTNIVMQKQPDFASSCFHLFVIETPDRDDFTAYLQDNEIGYGVHYPVPCHLQKAFAHLGYKAGDLPVSEYHSTHCLSLPMFPELTDWEVERVIDVCNKYRRII
ncbi:MAG: DegT/DnrJ/EryC1/StrS family aminotransferase [Spirochaetaceae bacterium]|jgi:dTDP-4-amino-4,6-dideoxygalactose transaminase|nr:DegT/DnrJ/EryC1/StrS family aminotransferase [Spirochaetaceae bacterium]